MSSKYKHIIALMTITITILLFSTPKEIVDKHIDLHDDIFCITYNCLQVDILFVEIEIPEQPGTEYEYTVVKKIDTTILFSYNQIRGSPFLTSI